jgi:hypothetical protein
MQDISVSFHPECPDSLGLCEPASDMLERIEGYNARNMRAELVEKVTNSRVSSYV